MLKPNHLKPGDKIAIVSLSNGMLGESWALHKLEIAKERFEKDFGLEVVCMPNALKGSDYLYRHPEARAEDLMQAFADSSIRAVINAIGGDDSIRLLPYIDFDIIHENPKIFTGFSDTTVGHMMMYHAGVISYYGASLMNNFAEYVKINDYSLQMIKKTLFEPQAVLDIPSAPYWYDDEDEKIWWKPENQHRAKAYHPELVGYEILQGTEPVEGELLGGCLDVFPMIVGTEIWPRLEAWRGKILYIETSEEDISAEYMLWYLRNLQAQGILHVIRGIIFGKPARRSKYQPYNETLKRILQQEAGLPDLPVMVNVNFGHAEPIGVIPQGCLCRLDPKRKTLTLLESATS